MFIIKCLIYLFAFLILMKQPQITFVEILKVSKNSLKIELKKIDIV